ncbi:hypothetical protein SDC9_173280 [bioreactor metagenome]|uniref:Uncharacterized protein n=1 Tax=bioreactor metagenome TaxID=1076179 RepID=A0A645GIY9_9ZZZZ
MANQMVLAGGRQFAVNDEKPEFAGHIHTAERTHADAGGHTGGGGLAHLCAAGEKCPRASGGEHRAAFAGESLGVGGGTAIH